MPDIKGVNLGGAPSKLTKKRHKALIDAVLLGMSKARAARLVGINPCSISTWLKKGKESEKTNKYTRFYKDYINAEEKFIEDNLRLIRSAAQGKYKTKEVRTTYNKEGAIKEQIEITKDLKPQWTASAWLLERKHPAEFSQHQIIDDNTSEKVAENLEDILNG